MSIILVTSWVTFFGSQRSSERWFTPQQRDIEWLSQKSICMPCTDEDSVCTLCACACEANLSDDKCPQPVSIPHAMGYLREVQSRVMHCRTEVPPRIWKRQQKPEGHHKHCNALPLGVQG